VFVRGLVYGVAGRVFLPVVGLRRGNRGMPVQRAKVIRPDRGRQAARVARRDLLCERSRMSVLPPFRGGPSGLRRYRSALSVSGSVPAWACVLLMAACQDAPTDPIARIVTPETAVSVALGVVLPEPELWLGETEADPSLLDAVARWRMSWDLPAGEGRPAREGLHAELARGLAPVLGPGRVKEEEARLAEGIARARELPEDDLGPEIVIRLGDAAVARARAARALRLGDPVEGLRYVLEGSDILREVGPEAVARALVAEVAELHGRLSDDETYSQQDRDRLGRLVIGGRQALEDEDWVRAIRRAYYAKGLLTDGR